MAEGKRKSRSSGLNPSMRRALSERLRSARLGTGLTMEQVSESVGVSPHMIWRWEDGRTAPMVDRLDDLATLYGVTVDWLLGRAVDNDIPLLKALVALRTAINSLPPDDFASVLEYLATGRRERDKKPGGATTAKLPKVVGGDFG